MAWDSCRSYVRQNVVHRERDGSYIKIKNALDRVFSSQASQHGKDKSQWHLRFVSSR